MALLTDDVDTTRKANHEFHQNHGNVASSEYIGTVNFVRNELHALSNDQHMKSYRSNSVPVLYIPSQPGLPIEDVELLVPQALWHFPVIASATPQPKVR